MSARLNVIAMAIGFALTAAEGAAQELPTRLTPEEIGRMVKAGAGAGTSGVNGIRTTLLSGDPAASGLYTIEIRVPAHTRIAAHTHRDERSGIVVSGHWYFGYGTRTSDSLVKVLAPGSFYTEPRDAAHFAITRDEPAIVYITGFGPTDTRYVDSTSDPRIKTTILPASPRSRQRP